MVFALTASRCASNTTTRLTQTRWRSIMAQATRQNITKSIDMDFVARTVLVLVNGVVLDDQEQILAAAEALANECEIEMPDFGFAA
jgi:hypothetical protein